jgi:hypothetical protein
MNNLSTSPVQFGPGSRFDLMPPYSSRFVAIVCLISLQRCDALTSRNYRISCTGTHRGSCRRSGVSLCLYKAMLGRLSEFMEPSVLVLGRDVNRIAISDFDHIVPLEPRALPIRIHLQEHTRWYGRLTASSLLSITRMNGCAAIFAQTRVGRNNRHYKCYKLRTMNEHMGDPHGNRSTARGDRRVTRIGKILRRTSLDEFPQGWNVIRGDVSLVGAPPTSS